MKLAYKYGCPSWAELDDVAIGQLRLANELWNALVEAERAHQAQIAAMWLRHPAVAAGVAELGKAVEGVAAVESEMRAARVEDSGTLPRRADAARLAAARKVHRDAKAAVKAAKGAVIEGALEPGFAELTASCRACQHKYTGRPDSLYREFGQRGLGWGTINDVFARYQIAHAREKALRIEGKPSELKFHSFDGSGTLTVKVMRQAGDPVPSPELLSSGTGKWRSVVQIAPWSGPAEGRPRGAARRGRITVRIGRIRALEPIEVSLPVVLHRWLPAGAEVKQVQVSRRRTGGRASLSVAVVAEVPDAPNAVADGAVALFPSWRSDEAGGILAARIESATTLPPLPHDLAGFILPAPDGRSALVRIPAVVRTAFERKERIRSYRDQILEHVRLIVVEALKEAPGLEEVLGVSAGNVSRWRSAANFDRLVRAWRAALAAGNTDVALACVPLGLITPVLGEIGGERLAAAGKPPVGVLACQPPRGKRGRPVGRPPHEHDLECWRLRDRHLWEFEVHEHAQARARRRDAYRKGAAWLCEGAGAVMLHDLDLAEMRRVPDVGRQDTERAARGRSNAQMAAPGELVGAVKAAAKARGIQVMLAGGRPKKAQKRTEG